MTKLPLTTFIAALSLCLPGRSPAADSGNATAYTALRSMGKSLGADTLNRVVEVTGRGGSPQPATWRIVIADGPGETREIKVSGARVVSQKTYRGAASQKTIRLEDLNLDSSGAFEEANSQARKARVPFSSLDYSLRVSEASNKPVWDLELVNDGGTHVGGLRLAAHDGKLLSTNGFAPGESSTVKPLVSANSDHDSVQPTRVGPSRTTTTTTKTYTTVRPGPPSRDEDERRDSTPSGSGGGFFSRAGNTLDHTTETVGDTASRTGQAVGRTMRRTGTRIQRFFTGGDNRSDDSSRQD